MLRHNVDNGVKHRIATFVTTGVVGLDPRNLVVGNYVIYHRHDGGMEAGVVSSWKDGLAFVRFTSGETAAACDPKQLEQVIAPATPNGTYKRKRMKGVDHAVDK